MVVIACYGIGRRHHPAVDGIEVRALREADVEQATALADEYVPDPPLSASLAERAGLAIVAVTGAGRVVGVCFGSVRGDAAGIAGIAVEHSFAGAGIGSRLLGRFELDARAAGASTISVGSAPGYVEHFYAKNGFLPTNYYLRTLSTLAPSTENGLELLRGREGDRDRVLNVRPLSGCSDAEKDRVRALFEASEIATIFGKELADDLG